MYDSKDIADKIKRISFDNGVSVSKMLSDIGLSAGTITNLNNGSMIKSDSLAKIADYLNVSIDYIMGRSSSGVVNNHCNNINGSNTINHVGTSGGAVPEEVPTVHQDKLVQEMVTAVEDFSKIDKLKVLQYIYELK